MRHYPLISKVREESEGEAQRQVPLEPLISLVQLPRRRRKRPLPNVRQDKLSLVGTLFNRCRRKADMSATAQLP